MSEISKIKVQDVLYDIKDERARDYTAYEVTATDVRYAEGEYKKTVTFADKGTFELSNKTPIPASMTEELYVYTNSEPSNSDVIIDWGDGEKTIFAEATDLVVTPEDNFEKKILAKHTYKTAGVYIVKIYGKGYWKLSHNEQSTTGNLMSRVFEDDLPIAEHLNSLSGFCSRALRLLYVNISSYHNVIAMPNITYMLSVCSNLQYAYGLKRMYNLYSCAGLFLNNVNLIDTDFRAPATVYMLDSCFHKCGSLTTAVQNLFCEKGKMPFVHKTISITNMFNGCTSLTGTIPADILWNSDNTFTGNSNTFALCPDSIKSQAPVSWGGTADDSIIVDKEQVLIDKIVSAIPKVTQEKF